MRCALSIAGSDSIGGAGIQADVKAMAAVGVHAHTAVTAVTAQNTRSVERIMPVPTDMVADQIDAVFADSDVRAVKTGMLYSKDIADIVADRLERRNVPLIVDPVLVAGVGDPLASDGLADAIRRALVPMCDILTPNRHEAEVLTGMRIKDEDDARRACEILGKEGTTVYLKGGHMDSRSVVDTLYNGAEFKRFEYPRLERAGHGGGCILSSYITAHIAKGTDAVNSIVRSREMIQDSIARMYVVGKGDKVVNPMSGTDAERADVLRAADGLGDWLVRVLPGEWVPGDGADIGFMMHGAKGPQDVASVPGMVRRDGRNRRGAARFGCSQVMWRILETLSEHDRGARAAVRLRDAGDLTSLLEEMGLEVVSAEGRDPAGSVSKAIRRRGSVPDVMVCRTGRGGASVLILGRDPQDIMDKIGPVL